MSEPAQTTRQRATKVAELVVTELLRRLSPAVLTKEDRDFVRTTVTEIVADEFEPRPRDVTEIPW